MKKIVSIMLALVLVLGSISFSFAASQNKVLSTVKALGIMVGDASGNMNTSANLTRAQFAKMLVVAAGKDGSLSEAGAGFSLFKDVNKTYWAGQYIYTAAKNGWLSGYSDSTFRPANNVKLEEACAAVIRMLGYKPADLVGSYPSAYLNKADELGLLDNVNSVRGQYITRGECANIFYNCLLASTSTGKSFGETIGCTVNGDNVGYTAAADTDSDGIYAGVISNVSTAASDSSDSGLESTVTVFCTDGLNRTFTIEKSTSYETGKLVKITISSGVCEISSLGKSGLSGKVNAKATALGDYTIAEDVQIIDVDDYGNAVAVSSAEIKNLSLSSDDVKYYSLNSSGALASLILNDRTGKLWDSVIMLSAESSSGQNMSVSGTYTYILDGKTQTLRTSDKAFSISTGGVKIKKDQTGSVQSMRNLSQVSLVTLTANTASDKTMTYPVADDLQVYLKSGDTYYLSDIATVTNGSYSLTGWYAQIGASNTVTIVVASPK